MASSSGEIILLGAPEHEDVKSSLSQELMEDWKKSKPTFGHQHYMRYLLSTGNLADVAFVVKDEKNDQTEKLLAHRPILKSKAVLFHNTFCSDGWIRAKDGLALEEIDLTSTQITGDVFKTFLEHVYLEQTTIKTDSVMELYCYVAHKYQIGDLKTKCEDFVEANIDKGNALKWFNLAIVNDIQGEVLDALISYICRNGKSILEKPGFLELNQDQLSLIFMRGRFKSSPMKLLRFCLCWTKKHFGSEKLSNFTELDTLFRDGLGLSLGYNLPNLTSSLISELHPSNSDEEYEIMRFQSRNNLKAWVYRRNRADRISFRVSAPIMLTAIGLYGEHGFKKSDDIDNDQFPAKYDVDVNVYIHGKSHKQLMHAYRRSGLDMDTTTCIYKVNFNPRYLHPDEWYTMSVRIAGPPSYSGQGGITEKLLRCQALPVLFEFKEASSTEEAAKLSNATGVPMGQIAQIFFKLASTKDKDDDDVEVVVLSGATA